MYALDTKNYERLISKRNPRTVDMLRQGAEAKLLSRLSYLPQPCPIPLLRSLHHSMDLVDRTQQAQARKREASRESGAGTTSPANNSNANHGGYQDIVPTQGALIDLFGPGTVFYRTRQRELAKEKKKNRIHMRGARTGLAAPLGHLVAPSGHVTAASGSQTTTYAGNGVHDNGYQTTGSSEGRRGSSNFNDFQSSDRSLAVLEERISAWHASMADGSSRERRKGNGTHAVKLQRVVLEVTRLTDSLLGAVLCNAK